MVDINAPLPDDVPLPIAKRGDGYFWGVGNLRHTAAQGEDEEIVNNNIKLFRAIFNDGLGSWEIRPLDYDEYPRGNYRRIDAGTRKRKPKRRKSRKRKPKRRKSRKRKSRKRQ